MLIVVASLILFFATVAVWVHSVTLNTDRYVQIANSLISDEAFDNALATYVTTRLFEQVDVEAALRDRLPDRMQFLAAPLAENLYRFVLEKANGVIASDQFRQIWEQANRTLHQQLVRFLRGDTEALVLTDGKVTLDLSAVVSVLRDRITASGVDLFEPVQPNNVDMNIVVLESEELQRLQSIVLWLDRLAVLLPVLAILCYALAIFISPPRARISTIIGSGAGMALSMVLIEIGLSLTRSWYLESMSSQILTPEGAAALFEAIFRLLRSMALWIQAFGVVIMIIAAGLGLIRRRSQA